MWSSSAVEGVSGPGDAQSGRPKGLRDGTGLLGEGPHGLVPDGEGKGDGTTVKAWRRARHRRPGSERGGRGPSHRRHTLAGAS